MLKALKASCWVKSCCCCCCWGFEDELNCELRNWEEFETKIFTHQNKEQHSKNSLSNFMTIETQHLSNIQSKSLQLRTAKRTKNLLRFYLCMIGEGRGVGCLGEHGRNREPQLYDTEHGSQCHQLIAGMWTTSNATLSSEWKGIARSGEKCVKSERTFWERPRVEKEVLIRKRCKVDHQKWSVGVVVTPWFPTPAPAVRFRYTPIYSPRLQGSTLMPWMTFLVECVLWWLKIGCDCPRSSTAEQMIANH